MGLPKQMFGAKQQVRDVGGSYKEAEDAAFAAFGFFNGRFPMLRSKGYLAHKWTLPSGCFLALLMGAVVLTPSRAVARDAGAIIGGIMGIAALAIIANGIATTQGNRSGYRKRAPQAAVAQKRQAISDPVGSLPSIKR
jgi:hypothetical protein